MTEKNYKRLKSAGFDDETGTFNPNILKRNSDKGVLRIFLKERGKRFGHVTVVAYDYNLVCNYFVVNPHRKGNPINLVCECDCGNLVYIKPARLYQDHTYPLNCGCEASKNKADAATKNAKHGYSREKLYIYLLSTMVPACYNPNYKKYPAFGAHGIRICKEWYDPNDIKTSYENFKKWSLENGYDPNYVPTCKQERLSLIRKDRYGDICPDNCYWGKLSENDFAKPSAQFFEYGNKRYTHNQWAQKIGLTPATISDRFKSGWNEFDAMTIPNDITRYVEAVDRGESPRRVKKLIRLDEYGNVEYNGARFDKDGMLRDDDGFIRLSYKSYNAYMDTCKKKK